MAKKRKTTSNRQGRQQTAEKRTARKTSAAGKPAKKKGRKKAAQEATSKRATSKKAPRRKSSPKKKAIAQSPQAATAEKSNFCIVGIGASAGGLSALKQFFAQVPDDSGLAYVVVVHLSPQYKSHLAELLQPHVKMPVEQVRDTVPLRPNHVYVIPPGANLDTIDTHLRLSELEERRQERAPIDHFFRTLAKTHDGDAVGVILTGTGSDGTLGIREIKEVGGVAMVQDPNEAEYDGMPQSAIATGVIDVVLPVEEIPAAIVRYCRTRPQLQLPAEGEELDSGLRRLLHKVFAQVRARTGRDFSRYKQNTILRRIRRRMPLRHIESFDAYVEILRQHPEEVRRLADDLLITVTNFFRDAEVYKSLERNVIPELFDGKDSDDAVRVWSVGCATGEEAYSLAMLLLEEAARREEPPRLQVFASDLHEYSLQRAREGFYPGDIETDVSPERLQRFFIKEHSGYRIRKEVRELVVFAPHNLLADPPFSRLDLISCRNLLIYLQREAQNDIVELCHYALRPGGRLLLGTTETLQSGELFRTQSKKRGIYIKRNVPAPQPRLPVFPLAHAPRVGEGESLPQGKRAHRDGEPPTYGNLHQRMVERYAPPSLLVNPDDKVVHLSEHVGRFLVLPGGELTSSVYKLVREELRTELRSVLHTARDQNRPASSEPVSVQFNGDAAHVVLHARPALEPSQQGFVLVIFEERSAAGRTQPPHPPAKEQSEPASRKDEGGRERQLEAELDLTRQRLQAVIEEYETSQEEMRASNEEMQSTNEELRSTMEELETSKEELQSMNEELQTVNQENRHKVEELAQLSADLQNLLGSTDIATLFLDKDLGVLRFTTKVRELFNVRTTDRGRPIGDFTHRLGYEELEDDANRVLEKLTPVERELQDEQGRWYMTRVLPYRDSEDRIAGVVITFVDITGQKEEEEEVRAAKEYAESIVETLHEPLLVLNDDLTVRTANQAFYDHFHVAAEETKGRKIYNLGNGQWDIPALRQLLEDVLPDSNVFNDYEVEHDFDHIGHRVMLLNGRRLDHVQLILLGIRDVTESRRVEQAIRESAQRLQVAVDAVGGAIYEYDVDRGETTFHMQRWAEIVGYRPEELPTQEKFTDWLEQQIHPEDYPSLHESFDQFVAGSVDSHDAEVRLRHKQGRWVWVRCVSQAMDRDASGRARRIVGMMIDVTERRRALESLREGVTPRE